MGDEDFIPHTKIIYWEHDAWGGEVWGYKKRHPPHSLAPTATVLILVVKIFLGVRRGRHVQSELWQALGVLETASSRSEDKLTHIIITVQTTTDKNNGQTLTLNIKKKKNVQIPPLLSIDFSNDITFKKDLFVDTFSITISSGVYTATSSGSVAVLTSNAGTSGVSGDLSLSTGSATVGDSGALDIGIGSSASGSGSSIAIPVGSGTDIGEAFSGTVWHHWYYRYDWEYGEAWQIPSWRWQITSRLMHGSQTPSCC